MSPDPLAPPDTAAPGDETHDELLVFLVDAIDRIADGLAGIADAINRLNDRQARDEQAVTPGLTWIPKG